MACRPDSTPSSRGHGTLSAFFLVLCACGGAFCCAHAAADIAAYAVWLAVTCARPPLQSQHIYTGTSRSSPACCRRCRRPSRERFWSGSGLLQLAGGGPRGHRQLAFDWRRFSWRTCRAFQCARQWPASSLLLNAAAVWCCGSTVWSVCWLDALLGAAQLVLSWEWH